MSNEQEVLDFAYGLAEKASRMIVDGSNARWKAGTDFEAKKNRVDLVTATDQAVEEMIKAAITEKYPSHQFIGEETYAAEGKMVFTDEYTWIVDPVDGTMKPTLQLHPLLVACSIGVMHNKVPVVGVIALPFLNQIFAARQGGGAFMNRTIPLPLTGGVPQPLTQLKDCLIGVEWGTDRSQATFGPKLESFARLAGSAEQGVPGGQMVHALRTTGTSACSIAAVIAGQLDVYFDAGMWPWDLCAGMIILRETGGYFSGGAKQFAKRATDEEIMMSRRCIAIRAVPPTETESTKEIQERLCKELYDVVVPWTNANMRSEEE